MLSGHLIQSDRNAWTMNPPDWVIYTARGAQQVDRCVEILHQGHHGTSTGRQCLEDGTELLSHLVGLSPALMVKGTHSLEDLVDSVSVAISVAQRDPDSDGVAGVAVDEEPAELRHQSLSHDRPACGEVVIPQGVDDRKRVGGEGPWSPH